MTMTTTATTLRNFYSQLPITSLCFIATRKLLSGSGAQISLYNLSDEDECILSSGKLGCNDRIDRLVGTWKIFDYERIHRIVHLDTTTCTNESSNVIHVALCAGHQVAILTFQNNTNSLKLAHVTKLKFPHWILDICKIESENMLAFVTVYNTIYLKKIDNLDVSSDSKVITMDEGPLLWSAAFSQAKYSTLSEIQLASGTMMQDILLSNPGSSTTIAKRLQGHKGTIFGLEFSPCKKHLATVSDDRTLRIWDLTTNELEVPSKILWGHQGRIWKCSWLDDCHIVTVGEDTRVFLWTLKREAPTSSLNETSVRFAEVGSYHEGHGIWSVACDKSCHLISSGGADGCINVTSLKSRSEFNVFELDSTKSKGFDIVSATEIVFLTNDGSVLLQNLRNNSTKEIFRHDKLSEKTLEVTSFNTSVFLTTQDGHGFCITVNEPSKYNHISFGNKFTNIFISYYNEHVVVILYDRKTGILDLWLLNDINSHVWNPRKVGYIQLDRKFGAILSIRVSSSTSKILIGTRNGSLLLYHIKDNWLNVDLQELNDVQVVDLHTDGITDINLPSKNQNLNDYIIETIGRDGLLIKTQVKKGTFQCLSCDKLSKGWLEKFVYIDQETYIASFELRECILLNRLGEQICLYKSSSIPTTWKIGLLDEKITFLSSTGRGMVHAQCPDMDSKLKRYALNNRGHGREIRTVDAIILKNNKLLIASGAENSIIKIGLVGQNGNYKTLYHSAAMGVALKSLIWFQSGDDSNELLLFAAGARMKLCCFKVSMIISDSVESINVNELSNAPTPLDKETRIMDLDLIKNDLDQILAVGGCSNGNILLWSFINDQFELLQEFNYSDVKNRKCILSLECRKLGKELHVFTGTTDGIISIWKIIDKKLLKERVGKVEMHQSGVNAMDIRMLEDEKSLLIASGGDDNGLSLVKLESGNDKLQIRQVYKVQDAHFAGIQGLQFFGDKNRLVSIGLDQRMKFWRIEPNEKGRQGQAFSFDLDSTIKQQMTQVVDCSSLKGLQDCDGDSILVIAGFGMEVWKSYRS